MAASPSSRSFVRYSFLATVVAGTLGTASVECGETASTCAVVRDTDPGTDLATLLQVQARRSRAPRAPGQQAPRAQRPDPGIATSKVQTAQFTASELRNSEEPTALARTVRADVIPVEAQQDFPDGTVDVGVCFSGGGTRSLSAIMGQLRALEHLGLVANVDGIVGVSGGAWASTIYMYADVPLAELLGPAPTNPSQLDLTTLRQPPPALGKTATKAYTSQFVAAMLRVDLDRFWSAGVGNIFLSPFGLFDLAEYASGNGGYMAASIAERDRIVARNPQLRKSKFTVPRPGRPKTFVMTSVLQSMGRRVISAAETVSLQVTPSWFGSPFYPDGKPVHFPSTDIICKIAKSASFCKPTCRWIGGGMIETFAAGGTTPVRESQHGGSTVPLPAPQRPLTLADAIGWSSALFVKPVGQVADVLAPLARLVPTVTYWPVLGKSYNVVPGCETTATKYEVGDGGIQDDIGLRAMLQRGARKVLWFVNMEYPIKDSFDWCTQGDAVVAPGFDPKDLVMPSIPALFGINTVVAPYDRTKNQVFPKAELAPMICELQTRKRAGKHALARRTLTVLPNSFHGISGGYTVDSLIYYLDRGGDFEAALPADTQTELAFGKKGGFANYPHYAVMFQNFPEVLRLTPEQVNLLAAQAEHAVLSDAQLFRDFLPVRV